MNSTEGLKNLLLKAIKLPDIKVFPGWGLQGATGYGETLETKNIVAGKLQTTLCESGLPYTYFSL